jgi:predicted glutamine amidotransferase
MCRLFALNASPQRVRATFWLLDSSDSFVSQSHRNPDGTGLGYFDERGMPVLDKQPLAAFDDPEFEREAKQVSSTTFISHVRHATTGPKTVEDCHPFVMDGRIFAHNGMLGGLDRLEARLGEDLALVKGQTDSERWFALVTREIRKSGGDVRAGITAAARWVAAELPVCSINFVLATQNELWAFRYPETDRLFVLDRPAGGPGGDRAMHYVSHHLRIHSQHLQECRSVVVASERLDDNPGWRLLRSGELIQVAPDLGVQSSTLVDRPPAHTLVAP